MIQAEVLQRFPGNQPQAIALRARLVQVCEDFVACGLADPKFVTELSSGIDQKFWSCLSEALVADRLSSMKFLPRPQIGAGPDFLISDGTRKVWIEVTCPEPIDVGNDWLNPPSAQAIDFPYVEILLRWTSAIKAKAERLVGDSQRKVLGYLEEGVVSPDDAYVIAVNACRMRNGPFSAMVGISQFPFAAEAVFPIGPYQLHLDRETLKTIGAAHQHRPFVRNKNGALVPANTFLDPRFAPVSAIWAVDLDGSESLGGSEPMLVVHNPNALNPIPQWFLPSGWDYVCATSTGELELTRVTRQESDS